MQTEWQRVEDLFHATLAIAPEERAAYLSNECGDNEPLRLEVESLISAFEVKNSFIEQPALSLGLGVLCESLSGLLVGRSLGHYQIIRLLGEGGMGEVYLAEDRVLERHVALKFIGGTLMDNEWSRAQLLQEARAVAKLENSNICAVYGMEELEGHHFIVMQYVEGETLSSVLRRGELEITRALEWADQLASVLTAAHARGIIHRDIKPQNIMVTPEGQLKVLDFGLAKFTRQIKDGGIETTGPNTQAGIIAGTAAYMSPEQERGEELDGRTDIFSFGIVLCEMLSWSNPSKYETDEATHDAIKAAAGNEGNGDKKLRGSLEQIVIKCLRKDRELRYESADQLRVEIERLRESLAPSPPIFWRRLRWPHYAIAAIVFVIILLTGAVSYRKITRTYTLAILPIVNVAEEENASLLSDGLTRNLADKFSYLPRLKVRVPSIKPKQDEKVDALAVGRNLQVEAVLTGELIKEGDAFKLRLRLLDTTGGLQTWENTFPVNEADLLILQDEIAKDVTSQLGMWLIGDEKRLLARRQTDSREALDYYTRGRHLWAKRDKKNMQEAISLFEQATDLDPTFAKAFAGLADCYALTTGTLYGPETTKAAMDKAIFNANKAVELDPSLAEAHTSMGIVTFLHSWDWQDAEQSFKKAIEIKPEYAPARFWYSTLLAAQKRFDESIDQGELAKSFDPYSRLADMNYGRALYYMRRYDDAAAHFERLLKQSPDYAQFLHIYGWIQIQQKRYDEAISTLEPLERLHAAAALGYAYGRAGKKDKALAILRELDELEKTFVVPPSEKALIYIGLGDRDMAFRLLEVCFEERNINLAFLTTDPIYDPLRSDPRFSDLANRLKLQI